MTKSILIASFHFLVILGIYSCEDHRHHHVLQSLHPRQGLQRVR